MTAQKPNGWAEELGQPEEEVVRFAPRGAEEEFEWQTGQRRTADAVTALPLKWPTKSKDRFELFDSWHDVSMQLVHRTNGRFRLLAVAKKVINWKSGAILNSNADLAARAGACAEKTISRNVAQDVALGIFIVKFGWRRSGHQIVRTRMLRPALPLNLPRGIKLPTFAFEVDDSGPDCPGEG